jgi:hypothetical protein
MDEADVKVDEPAEDVPPPVARTSFSVSFPVHAGVRTELEKGPFPFGDWWRARVRGGRHWRVPSELPWSYGVSETGAVEAAVALWAQAGQPGLTQADEADAETAADNTAIAATPSLPPTIDDELGATLVAARPGRKKPVRYKLREPARVVLRAVATALHEGAPAITLTRSTGRPVEVEVASIVEISDGAPEAAREDEEQVEGGDPEAGEDPAPPDDEDTPK